jgi:hypothetical protein
MNVTTHLATATSVATSVAAPAPALAPAPDETGGGKDDARTDGKHSPADPAFRSLLDAAARPPQTGRGEATGRRASRKAAHPGDASRTETVGGTPDRPGTPDPIACPCTPEGFVTALDGDGGAVSCRPSLTSSVSTSRAPDEGAPDAGVPPDALPPRLPVPPAAPASLLESKVAPASGGGANPEPAPGPHAGPPPRPGPHAPGASRRIPTTRDPLASGVETPPTGPSSLDVGPTAASVLAETGADVSGKILTTANAPPLDPGPAVPPPRSEGRTLAESVVNKAVLGHAAHGELDHPELGPIRVTARLRDGEVDVHVTAQRLETVAILVPRIDAMAAAANVPAARIDVGIRGDAPFAQPDASGNGSSPSDDPARRDQDPDNLDGHPTQAGPRRVRIVL